MPLKTRTVQDIITKPGANTDAENNPQFPSPKSQIPKTFDF
jgi:hypothetical protein